MAQALRQLRPGSARPELLVDNAGPARVIDPVPLPAPPAQFQQDKSSVGRTDAPPFQRMVRMLTALPLNEGPRLLLSPVLVRDTALSYLADPDGNILGVPGLWCWRMLDARWTENTRRIAG